MSALSLLPLVRVRDGVQTDEDWTLAIAFYLDDGITPINLIGLTFLLNVGAFATLTSGAGQILVSGPANNLLVITALAAAKSSWPLGVYPITLTVSDGVNTRDIFALSTLAVGSPQVARVSIAAAPDATVPALAAALPASIAQAMQALQPAAMAAALAGLPSPQLALLAQAVFAALPTQVGANSPVPAGQAFVNNSGYAVVAP